MRGFLANMAFGKLISQVLFPIPTYRDARTHMCDRAMGGHMDKNVTERWVSI